MKPGSIYAAFKSKENLYALSLEHYFTYNQAAVVQGVLETPSPLKGLIGMIRAMGRASEDEPRRQPCMLIKAVINATEDTAETAELARGYRKRMDQIIIEAFEKAQQIGESPAQVDTSALAQQFQSDMMGLQIDAQMRIGEDRFKTNVEAKAKHYESLGTSVS